MAGPVALAAAQQIATSVAISGIMGELLSPPLRAAQAGLNYAWPNLLPTAGDLIRAFHAGLMDVPLFQKIMYMQGVDTGPKVGGVAWKRTELETWRAQSWDAVMAASMPLPTIGDLREARNRGFIDNDTYFKWARTQGYSEDMLKTVILPLRSQIPASSDLIRFAVKDVWNRDVVARFQYDAEFPEEFDWWLWAQGFIDDPRKVFDKDFGGDLNTWAKAYWRAHWQIISPTQAYSALHRLRPGLEGTNHSTPNNIKFDVDDLRTVLKIHDYPPFFRNILQAISYRLLTRVDIRRAYRIGLIKDKWELIQYYKDLGYNTREATILAEITIQEYQPKKVVRKKAITKASVCSLYSSGVMSREAALTMLYRLSIDDPDLLAIFDKFSPGDQLGKAAADPDVLHFLNVCDLKANEAIIKESLRAIKKRYLMGDVSDLDLPSELDKIGINQPAKGRYLQRWRTLKVVDQKYTMTELAQRHCKLGLITRSQFMTRLINLDWSGDDRKRISGFTKCKADSGMAGTEPADFGINDDA